MPDLTPIKAVPRRRVQRLEPVDTPRPLESAVQAPRTRLGPIFNRARDIIAANMNDMVDSAADPARMIRTIIVEMEEVLVDVRASAARQIADLGDLRCAAARLAERADDWHERACIALEKGREDLARQALAQKAKTASAIAAMEEDMAGVEKMLIDYEADIERLTAKLRDARGRQASVMGRIEAAMHRARTGELVHGERTAGALAGFAALERDADLAEARADAQMLGSRPSLEEEIAALAAQSAVEDDLRQMKAALAAKGK